MGAGKDAPADAAIAVHALTKRFGALYRLVCPAAWEAARALAAPLVRDVTTYGHDLRVLTRAAETSAADLRTLLDAQGLEVQALHRVERTIEAVFISGIGEAAPVRER